MNYCDKCGVKIASDTIFCPLCGAECREADGFFESGFPSYERAFKKKILIRSLAFLSATGCIVCIILNILLTKGMAWSAIVTASVLYLWLTYLYSIRRHKNLCYIGMAQTLSISGLLFVIDYAADFHKWSTNYAIPMLIAAGVLYCTVAVVSRPSRFFDESVYLLILVIFGLVPMILYFTDLCTVFWPSAAASGLSVIILAAVFVFSDKKARQELKRRLHF